jgi:hypothetical protein
VNKAVCGVYCQTCNGVIRNGFFIVDNPFAVPVSGSKQQTFYMQWNTGGQYDLSGQSNWGSNATTIAAVNGTGLVNGVSPGSVTISAQDRYYEYQYVSNYCTPGYPCPVIYYPGAQGPGNVVQLTLQGNEYNSLFVGTDANLATPNSIFATVSPSGGSFSKTSSESSDTFADVQSGGPGWVVKTTTQSTAAADRRITITYTVSGQPSVSQHLDLTARQFAYVTNNTPSNTCALGYGTTRTYTYTPYTHPDKAAVQAGIGLSGTAVSESFDTQPPTGTVTGSGSLDANSVFTDTISYCSSSPLGASPTVTQTISIAGYQVRRNTLQYSSNGVSYTSLGPTE